MQFIISDIQIIFYLLYPRAFNPFQPNVIFSLLVPQWKEEGWFLVSINIYVKKSALSNYGTFNNV